MEKTDKVCDDGSEELLPRDWNPIRDSYEDETYNLYQHGPGAQLGPNLQAGVLAKLSKSKSTNSKNEHQPYLVFVKYPKTFNTRTARNLCESFAHIVRVNEYDKMIFVTFQTIGDMDAAFQALQKIDLNFKVEIGRKTFSNKKQEEMPVSFTPQIMEKLLPEFDDTTENSKDDGCADSPGPLLEMRSLKLENAFPSRPIIAEEIIVSAEDYNGENLLKINDPLKHFLIERHSHDLERWFLRNEIEVESITKPQSNFKTGRYCMSEKFKMKLFSLHQASKGTYDPETDIYESLHDGAEFSFCENCDNFGNDETAEFSQPIVEDPMKYMPSSKEEVRIVSVINTNLVFLVSNESPVPEKYYKTVVDVAVRGKRAQVLREPPILGQVVITKFEEQVCRAIVLNNKDLSRIKVCYIDYGNIEEKSMEELHEAPEGIAKLTRFAIPVLLKDVPDYYMTRKIRTFLYYYLRNKPLKIEYDEKTDFIAEKNMYQVKLFDEVLEKSINSSLNRIFKSVEDNDNLYLVEAMLPSGNNIKLVIMDTSLMAETQMIVCTTKQYALEIQKFQKDLEIYANSSEMPQFAPRSSDYCLARYEVDRKWYRGQCLEKVGDGYPAILFIDYGNVAYVSVNDIRSYPTQFDVPIFTEEFHIKGLPTQIDDELAAKLQKLLPVGVEIEFDFVEIDDKGENVITYSKILDALKANQKDSQ